MLKGYNFKLGHTGRLFKSYMIADEPGLVIEISDAIGSRLVKYYDICGQYDSVGAMISNDDWGFNSQTMLSVKDMQEHIIPWHKKIAETIHTSGRPAIHAAGWTR